MIIPAARGGFCLYFYFIRGSSNGRTAGFGPVDRGSIPCPRANMTSHEIRKKYLEFFQSKGHTIIPSASLLPVNDPSTLFISSGMQPLIPYLLGEKHPGGKRLADSQKSFRCEDIEEVGDRRHSTFFEMLGNWSLGDYFKEEQLPWIYEFLTNELKFDPQQFYVSVFRGNKKIGVARDTKSARIWQEIFSQAGIKAKTVDHSERDGTRGGRIFYYPETKNWWSRSGTPDNMPVGEIGGPDSEVFYDLGAEFKLHENSSWRDQPCHINCDCGRFIEIGNSVFIEFEKTESGFKPLKQQNVDFGGGLERMAMIAQKQNSIYKTDLYINLLNKISQLVDGKKYHENMKPFEIIADHLKAATFIMGDDRGVAPANVDQGYLVRRLIRRAIRCGRELGITASPWTAEIARIVIKDYESAYPELKRHANFITDELDKEEKKFMITLAKGESMIKGGKLNGEAAFNLFQTYGYPLELTEEIAGERGITLSRDFPLEFKKAMAKHQALSRTASAGKFKGGLADSSEETKKLHTAAHLLLAALRQVLGDHVTQKGSNITAQRLRFDFSHKEKLTDEQKKSVTDLVNRAIQAGYEIKCGEMSLAKAKSCGAMGVFEDKYGGQVKVYTIGNPSTSSEPPFSREICGGPHADNTADLGKFKIIKETSSSAGVRRIKAVLE